LISGAKPYIPKYKRLEELERLEAEKREAEAAKSGLEAISVLREKSEVCGKKGDKVMEEEEEESEGEFDNYRESSSESE